ncbi:MAG: nucleotidyltransferase family protein [Actinomycetota bacterium]|nr:nucleotidyltransferase family protein [Actinomycetota bacterium]
MGHGAPPEGVEVDEGLFHAVLADAIAALDRDEIPYLLMGGVSSASLGRPRGTNDIDLFVRPEAAHLTLKALEGAGFTTDETDPRWLYKAFKHDILVDVVFRSSGDIYLDDEMMARARLVDVRGCPARLIAPEDLLIVKALTADEHVPHHWHDALGIISASDLDWDYLVARARRHGARRVLSLLLYAQSDDLGVPVRPVKALYEWIFGE